MRLRRLVLARYGRFTDRTIEFGAAAEGLPDLHVVYGPNEAGKSTLFSAYLDLLFGIEAQSRYGFLHPYDTMRVGGCLELHDGPRELVRIKRPAPTLRDSALEPVAQGLLAGELGGLDRAAYRTMFSLDDDTLESGGDSILASNGELGQLLFSASAGLAELSRTLLDIRAVADGFTRPNARSGELHGLKATLAVLRQERDALDTQATAYTQLAKARDAAATAYDAALAELEAGEAELARVRRLRAALPRLAAWRGLRERIERFGELPAAPSGWQAELPALEQAEHRHRSATEQAGAELRRLCGCLEALRVDEAALARSGRLAHLEAHAARNLTAELDLPPRRTDLARADEAVRGVLARMGREGEAEPGRLLLGAAQSAGLDELMRQRSGVDARLATARAELLDATQGLAEARHALNASEAAPPPGTLPLVAAALAAWRASDHLPRLRAGLAARDRHAAATRTRLAMLEPWSGDEAALAALVLPDAGTVQGWQEEAVRGAGLVARAQEQVERLEAELTPRRAELAAFGATAGLLSDQEAAELRSLREAAWARHRSGLDARTADAFEDALRRDDAAGATRLGRERELARLHETLQAVRVREAELEAARRRLSRALDARDGEAARLQAALAAIDPALSGLSAATLAAWAGRRAEAVASWQQLRDAEREAGQAHEDEAALRDRLQEALAQAGAQGGPGRGQGRGPGLVADVLAVLAQEALDREARRALLRTAMADSERAVRAREAAVDAAGRADADWQAAWLAACSDCWLGPAAAAAPVAAVQAILAAAAGLGAALERRSDLAGRIRDMEADQAAFARTVEGLVAELGIAPEGRVGPELARAVLDRVQEAVRADAERRGLQDALARAEATEREAQWGARAHAARVREMTDVLRAGSLIEVAERLRDIAERAGLATQAAATEQEVLTALDVGTLAEAQALLEGRVGAELEGEEARLAAQVGAVQGRVRTLFADRQSAADRIDAVGGDDAAARLEERRRTQLLEIEDKAQHYLRLRIGVAAADRALRAYRDQHRSSMMRQASDAFGLISRGAYRGLGTQPGKDGDRLVALSADGGSKLAQDLSKGTRFQLYLALRAAGYREFARLRPTVPFIADDIMETFDDLRAEETLKVLADMSRLGQVIYLTHHGHLRDIAERTVPGVRLHDLAA